MKKCLFCSLRTGSILIAIWDIIAGIINLGLPVAAYQLLRSATRTVVDTRYKDGKDVVLDPTDVEDSIAHLETEEISFWTTSNTSLIVSGIIFISLGSFLILGIKAKSEKLLLIWMVCSLIVRILMIPFWIFVGYFYGLIADIIIVTLEVLFIKVVYDYRKKVKEDNSNAAIPSVVKPLTRYPN